MSAKFPPCLPPDGSAAPVLKRRCAHQARCVMSASINVVHAVGGMQMKFATSSKTIAPASVLRQRFGNDGRQHGFEVERN